MKVKKVLGLLLAVSMTVGMLAGCGNDGNDQPAGNSTGQSSGGQEGGNGSQDDGNGGDAEIGRASCRERV